MSSPRARGPDPVEIDDAEGRLSARCAEVTVEREAT